MHSAGHLAEVTGNATWERLFATRISTPLGLTQADYQGLGLTSNPRIAGGLRSTLPEYARIIEMLINGGVYQGVDVLGQSSVDETQKNKAKAFRLSKQ